MKVFPFVCVLYLFCVVAPSNSIFDFNSNCNLDNWYVVNDGVMGGLSEGHLTITKEGHGLFYGNVSLENYGGFTSIRYLLDNKKIKENAFCNIRLKGDGKNYQFRVKSDEYQGFSYIYEFNTSGEWENIKIPLHEMYPSFRGRRLDMPNFSGEQIAEITFLIANKKAESFNLYIDQITVE